MGKFKFLMFIDDDLPTNFYHEIIVKEANVCEKYTFYDNATDALEYLAFAKEKNDLFPDIVFLDINMPKIDGWMFLDKLRKIGITNLPVIIMLTTTLNPTSKNKAELIESIKGYNNKPLTEKFLNYLHNGIFVEKKSISTLLAQ